MKLINYGSTHRETSKHFKWHVFFYLLFILSYKPIYLFLLNPINFFCLLYNGNVEEFEEKKCELLDTYEMPSVARTNVENKGSLKMAQIVIDCSMSQ